LIAANEVKKYGLWSACGMTVFGLDFLAARHGQMVLAARDRLQ